MKKLFFLFFSLINTSSLFAQKDTLPNFTANKKDGTISLSWINGYKNVTQINIQRSKDSLKNFSTIHTLPNPNVKSYSYVDKTAKNDSGFYRIFILFEGSHYVFTTSRQLLIDTTRASSSQTNPAINEKLKQKEEKTVSEKQKEEKPAPPPKPVWVPSLTIFTGDDGNAIIKLPDAATKKYAVKFLKEDGSTVLDSYTFGNTGSDLSWYRFPDGGAWAISPTASTTKGLSNNTPFHPIVLASTRANPSPTSARL